MTPTELMILSLVIAIAGHAVVMFMKSPKEAIKELTAAVAEIREDHELLARRFERHDVIAAKLEQALDRLTQRIDRLEPFVKRPRGN